MKYRIALHQSVVCHEAHFKIEFVNYTEDGGMPPRAKARLGQNSEGNAATHTPGCYNQALKV